MDNMKKISVIIPAHNEERYIASTIESIKAQRYPSEYVQIIVVDNNSTDKTKELAQKAGATVIDCPHGLVGAVRNKGVSHSDGAILAFIDADCEAPPNWLSTAVSHLDQSGLGAIGGPCLLPQRTTWVERTFTTTPKLSENEVQRLAGSSMIVRRSDFEAIAGFDESLSAGEDDEISARIRSSGFKILSTPECAVVHNGYPKSLRAIFAKQLWHGRNQLEAAESFLDPTLILTHAFAGSLLIALFASISLSASVAFLCIGCAIGLSIALSLIKILRSGSSPFRLPALSLINIAYLSGRSVALIGNYWRKLTTNSKKPNRKNHGTETP